jgi:phosphoribosyl 1,2-cyclic phosphate phosphodiesterase
MRLTILGSGGCMVIPKPLCRCAVCEEARVKGPPYERTGPSAYLHDEHLLIDTPAEIALQLNRSRITRIQGLLFTHLDPDHVEGFRVVEQITLDFRTWRAYPRKRIRLILPEALNVRLGDLRSLYGPVIDFFERQGFVERTSFAGGIRIGSVRVRAVPVDRGSQVSFIYAFEKKAKKIVYAPCDIRPFPEQREELGNPDLLVIQPGIFEKGLKHRFRYPEDHISRSTLYTFEETVALGKRIGAKKILFTHLEEYWNRGYDEYRALEKRVPNIRFACDGMTISV